MVISSKDELVKYIKENDSAKIKTGNHSLEKGTQETEIKRKNFKGFKFIGDFQGVDIKGCKFVDCVFENIFGFFLIFNKCKFVNCQFKNSRFSHLDLAWEELAFTDCSFTNVQWDEGALYNVYLQNCKFRNFNLLGIYPLFYIVFDTCNIENSQFQSIQYYKDESEIDEEIEDIIFEKCIIEYSYFNSVDFRNSFFLNTVLYKSAFIDCQFKASTISYTDGSSLPNYASIDLQSIIKSDKFDKIVLEKYFNIHEPEVQAIAKNVTSKMDFKTVFISYSFKDAAFANFLNTELNNRGIKTFLWSKDAPSGQPLEDIMSSNVKKHDKTLFIASANSLRSSACQYELSEGRKKQEATWETVFFPIHIDDFLFKVKKSQIRPVDKAEEYWGNIEELKRINSTDFTKFDINDYDAAELESKIDKIIRELKLQSE